MAKTKLEQFAEAIVEQQLNQLDEQLDILNKKMEVFDRVKVERDKLMAARRALLGVGSRTSANAGNRTTSDEVAQSMELHVGYTTQELASRLSTTDAVIRGHLSRGNNERWFKFGNLWYKRDPEEGVNDATDLKPEDGRNNGEVPEGVMEDDGE